MVMFWLLVTALVAERMIELRLASRNFDRLVERGGIEVGRSHYPAIVVLHAAFFVTLATEYILRGPELPDYWPVFATLFALAQLLRIWVLQTMGGRWTTRVVVVPHESLVSRGPYRLMRHPNYIVVALEILSFPMIFGLYWTAAIFTLANALLLLLVRIPIESTALRRVGHLPSSQ